MNSVSTYANASDLTYALVGSSYYEQDDNYDRHNLMVGEDNSDDGLSSDKLYGVDLADDGQLAFQLDDEATKATLLERLGLDLDEDRVGNHKLYDFDQDIPTDGHKEHSRHYADF